MNIDFSTSAGSGRIHEVSEKATALLVGVYEKSSEKKITEDHLAELSRLADTFGIEHSYPITAPLRKIEASTYLGKGKIDEIRLLAEEKNCDLIIFDEEISPQQQRNIEKMVKKPVIDRAELILGVFSQRAQTREAKIQVDLATFRYQLPRLKRLWTHLERQRTGGGTGRGGYLKGAGERQIEIDRRLIKSKISKLEKELKVVIKQRETQRSSRLRTHLPIFAIVGYTNAGKSTLLEALTKANVFIEDKLFATLDTTTRKFFLPNQQSILFIDTVGFIRKLPHQLIAAFKSTLEEVLFADVLLHVVDGSSEEALDQAKTTKEILQELGMQEKPTITILNKVDQGFSTQAKKLRFLYPNVIPISAIQKEGFSSLLDKMMKELTKLRKKGTFHFDQNEYKNYAELAKDGYLIDTRYEGNKIIVEAEVPKRLWHLYERFLA